MNLLYVLDLIGTVAFAVSGALAAIQRKMDLLGVIVLATVTAIGGGTLRDLLLGDTPPFCFKDETYLLLSLGTALAVFAFYTQFSIWSKTLHVFDAIGLGTFVVIGCGKAMSFSVGPVGAVILGVMTATAGGAIRDVLSGQVPMILQREVYASACIAGAVLMVAMRHLGAPSAFSLVLPALVVIIIRLFALRYNWALPRRQAD